MLDNILTFKFHSGEPMSLQDLLDDYNGIISPKDLYSNTFDDVTAHAVHLSDKYLQICIDTQDDIDDTILFYTRQVNNFARLRTIIAQFDFVYKSYSNVSNSLRFFIYFLLWFQVYFISLYGFFYF
jgi:hypothetical protein